MQWHSSPRRATCSGIHPLAHRPLPVWWGVSGTPTGAEEEGNATSGSLTQIPWSQGTSSFNAAADATSCVPSFPPVSVTLLWPSSPHNCALFGSFYDDSSGWPAAHPACSAAVHRGLWRSSLSSNHRAQYLSNTSCSAWLLCGCANRCKPGFTPFYPNNSFSVMATEIKPLKQHEIPFISWCVCWSSCCTND